MPKFVWPNLNPLMTAHKNKLWQFIIKLLKITKKAFFCRIFLFYLKIPLNFPTIRYHPLPPYVKLPAACYTANKLFSPSLFPAQFSSIFIFLLHFFHFPKHKRETRRKSPPFSSFFPPQLSGWVGFGVFG